MTGKWNKELASAFEAPEPRRKERFLRTLRYPRLSYCGFLFSQLSYLRKRVWAVSAALLLICMALRILKPDQLLTDFPRGGLWIIAALLPFLALLAAVELARSACFRMEELEMSCRFSLHQVVMARGLLLGAGNGLVLLAIPLLLGTITPYGAARISLYLLTPYFLTGALCLLILNQTRGREGLYGCAGAACAVSALDFMSGELFRNLYDAANLRWWLLLSALCAVLFILQLYRLFRQTEEIKWNLFLIG